MNLIPLYALIFKSHTTPTKFMMAIASISWVIFEYYMHGYLHFFFWLVLLYGIGLIWRIFDYSHRSILPKILYTLGATLWSYEAWVNILIGDIHSDHLLLPVVFSLSSLWLLLRCGTGEIINKNLKHYCTMYNLPIIEDRIEK